MKLVKEVLDEGVPLQMGRVSVRCKHTWPKERKEITDLLVFGPTASPTDHSQDPVLANWCKHEPILCSASLKAMSRKGTLNTSTSGCFVVPLLNRVVGELLAWLYTPFAPIDGKMQLSGSSSCA